MKLSCLPVSLFPEFTEGRLDIVGWAKIARETGFDGFDISVMHIKNHTPTYLGPLKKQIAEVGIPVVMVSSYPDFTNPDASQRQREAAYLEYNMAVAAELGGKYLRVLAGQAHPGVGREEGIARAVEGLRHATTTALKYGITLVYENHAKPGAWNYIDFSFPPDIFLDVFNGIKDTTIMLNFDIGNSTAEGKEKGDELRLLSKVVDKVATLHVCDMKQLGVFSPTLVGTGVTPVVELLAFVRKHGFDGWLCIEEAGGLGVEGVKKAHDYVREAWKKAGAV
jgi:sugar phosphate isomerase/epimerase